MTPTMAEGNNYLRASKASNLIGIMTFKYAASWLYCIHIATIYSNLSVTFCSLCDMRGDGRLQEGQRLVLMLSLLPALLACVHWRQGSMIIQLKLRGPLTAREGVLSWVRAQAFFSWRNWSMPWKGRLKFMLRYRTLAVMAPRTKIAVSTCQPDSVTVLMSCFQCTHRFCKMMMRC